MGFQVSPEHGKCNILVEVELSQRGQEKFMSMSIFQGMEPPTYYLQMQWGCDLSPKVGSILHLKSEELVTICNNKKMQVSYIRY